LDYTIRKFIKSYGNNVKHKINFIFTLIWNEGVQQSSIAGRSKR